MRSVGLAKEFGTPATRDKRSKLGTRRFVRMVKNHAVLRPACGCVIPFATYMGDPLVCTDCGGARLTPGEAAK